MKARLGKVDGFDNTSDFLDKIVRAKDVKVSPAKAAVTISPAKAATVVYEAAQAAPDTKPLPPIGAQEVEKAVTKKEPEPRTTTESKEQANKD